MKTNIFDIDKQRDPLLPSDEEMNLVNTNFWKKIEENKISQKEVSKPSYQIKWGTLRIAAALIFIILLSVGYNMMNTQPKDNLSKWANEATVEEMTLINELELTNIDNDDYYTELSHLE